MISPFGEVDLSQPHTVLVVHHPTVIPPLRRARLAPGTYVVPGDVRAKLGNIRERRAMASGVFSISFRESAPELVSAQTQIETPPAVETPDTVTLRGNARCGRLAEFIKSGDRVETCGVLFQQLDHPEHGLCAVFVLDDHSYIKSVDELLGLNMTISSWLNGVKEPNEPTQANEEDPADAAGEEATDSDTGAVDEAAEGVDVGEGAEADCAAGTTGTATTESDGIDDPDEPIVLTGESISDILGF